MWKQNISPCIFLYFLMAYCTTSDLIIYVFPWHTCHKIQFNRYTVVRSKEKETLLTLIEGKSSIFEFPFTMNCFLYDVGKIFKKFSRFIVARWTLGRSFNCIEIRISQLRILEWYCIYNYAILILPQSRQKKLHERWYGLFFSLTGLHPLYENNVTIWI